MTLQDLRSQVDVVDEKMLKLLSERMKLARKISELKKLEGRAIVDPAREKVLLAQVEKKAKSLGLPAKEVQSIWQKILKLSHLVQK